MIVLSISINTIFENGLGIIISILACSKYGPHFNQRANPLTETSSAIPMSPSLAAIRNPIKSLILRNKIIYLTFKCALIYVNVSYLWNSTFFFIGKIGTRCLKTHVSGKILIAAETALSSRTTAASAELQPLFFWIFCLSATCPETFTAYRACARPIKIIYNSSNSVMH